VSSTLKQRNISYKIHVSNLLTQFLIYFILGHIIDNKLVDDKDINKELKSLFMRTNILSRRFNRCDLQVKIRIFQ